MHDEKGRDDKHLAAQVLAMANLKCWLQETVSIPVMVATTSFGAGVDAPGVRTVLHYTAILGGIIGYAQQTGRAGRDGLPALALNVNPIPTVFVKEKIRFRQHGHTRDGNLWRVFERASISSIPWYHCSTLQSQPATAPYDYKVKAETHLNSTT